MLLVTQVAPCSPVAVDIPAHHHVRRACVMANGWGAAGVSISQRAASNKPPAAVHRAVHIICLTYANYLPNAISCDQNLYALVRVERTHSHMYIVVVTGTSV